jgi:hypothetical protein
MTARRSLALASALLAALLASACDRPGANLHRVTGRVTWQGQPVPTGLIRFEPDAAAGNTGPGVVAEISQGRYATPRDKGVVGGRYRVVISGYDGVPFDRPEEGFRDTVGKPLFLDRVEEVEFPRQACTRDFDLAAP